MRVALIGFMGSGKTTVARELSRLLSLPAVELDDRILERSNRGSVREIFEIDGEPRFRALEREVCAELGAAPDVLVSCGGGVIESPENVSALRAGGGAVVFLRTSFECIASRLEGDTTRPLFQDRDEARRLYDSRVLRYENAATHVVDTDGRTPADVAAAIVKELKR